MEDLREILTCSPNQMEDWKMICEAFAKKFGYKLIFVNETSCGVQLKNGSFKHIYIDEMVEILKNVDNA